MGWDGKTATTSSLVSHGVPAYFYVFDGTLNTDAGASCETTCNSEPQLDECYRLEWVTESSAYDESGKRLQHPDGSLVDGRENFAIWYSFYRSRALATLSAAKIAFYNLSPDVRFTWQDLATCTSFTSEATACGKNKLKPYSAKHRGEFYTWLRKRYFNTGTPLPAAMKRAGDFLTTTAPWQKDPYAATGNNAGNTYACRPSYHVMMTDGMWNADAAAPTGARLDHSTFTTAGGKKYAGKEYNQHKPFYDAAGTASKPTLADLAMHYWATDLNSSLDNKIPAYIPYPDSDPTKEYWDPRNNPAEWQSMSNFIMALGLTTSLGSGSNSDLPWTGVTHGGAGYDALKSGAKNWPTASNGSSNNVYDLWHAAINSRGEFYSVDSPDAMVQAFKDILSRIAERKASAAIPGIGMITDEDGDNPLEFHFYQTSYDSSAGWSGELTKVKSRRYWDDATGSYHNVEEVVWQANDKVPAHNVRNIKMASSSGALADFKSGNLASSSLYEGKSLAHWLAVNPEPSSQESFTAAERLNYLRGDNSNASEDAGKMRVRSSRLGDFVASQPAVVSDQGRYLAGFANKLEGGNKYTTFMGAIKNRPTRVYVGGNDGMLHSFDASTGQEVFAFVPTAVFSTLNELTGKGYSHRFYVDGTPVISDVYDSAAGKWRTILVGTLRAGGKGLFALDITDPDDIKLLWELHEYNIPSKDKSGTTVTAKPGYSFSKPTVARLHNGRWAVVTGNGYKGDGTNNGKAALYVIDAITGDLTKTLEVQGDVGENGLSTPRLADYDADGIADYAYAGDIQGNLWRFDLLGSDAVPYIENTQQGYYGGKETTTAKFAVSFGGNPLFKARSTVGSKNQPITAAPSISRHPQRNGYIISVGTGRYVEYGDKAGETSYAQTVYGIWDQKTKAEVTTASDVVLRSKLHKQEFKEVTLGTGATSGLERKAKIIKGQDASAGEGIKWDTHKGWYLDLAVGVKYEGEMMIEDMRVLGNTLIFQTLLPNEDPCSNGASSWLYAIDVRSGGVTDHHVFDTRAGNTILSGIEFGSEGGVSISQDEGGYRANAPGDVEPLVPDPSSLGRQSWRLIQNP